MFFFSVCFSFTQWNPPWRCRGRACTSPGPGSGADVFGEVLICFQVHPTHFPVGPCCRLTIAFSPASPPPPGGGLQHICLAGGGQGLVDGWLKAAHVLHSGTVCLHGLHVLVQDGKNLIVQDLVLPDPVGHLLQGLQTRMFRLGWEERPRSKGRVRRTQVPDASVTMPLSCLKDFMGSQIKC